MKSNALVALSVCVLAALNYGIYGKEQIKNNGETILLELAPVDPRSLIQGDYMRLRYAIENIASPIDPPRAEKRGHVVIKPNSKNIAQFVRFYSGELLSEDEKLLYFHGKYRVDIVPDSFLFQEGHAKYYEDAKYGVFKFDKPNSYLA